MRVAVTGATGLVGRRLCRALLERGDELVVLSRDPTRASGLGASATHAWSPEGEPAAGLLAGVEGVVHLAGESVQGRWTRAKKAAILASREEGTRSIVTAIAAARDPDPTQGPQVLVSASAVGWYGERGDDFLSEADPSGDDFLAGVCEAWEAEAVRAESLGVRVAPLRFGLVLAPEGGALKEMRLPFSLGLGGPLGTGRQWWSWVHIEDLIALILLALRDTSLTGPVNVTSPEPVRQRDFAKGLGAALGRPAILSAPRWALRLALGEFSTEVLTSKRVLPKSALAAGFEFQFPTLAPALKDLLAPAS
ncbi:MAG: TIGR01777 family oxidoreductase [Planctomycetes bacterium]|nr:TIGR01777 family oxidoreductase [Planctomycetota bacterium]